jgi:hypothetical protein
MIRILQKITESPYLNLVSGLILLTTAGIEIFRTLDEGLIGAHHGVAIFGLIEIVKTLPEILHGTEEVCKI